MTVRAHSRLCLKYTNIIGLMEPDECGNVYKLVRCGSSVIIVFNYLVVNSDFIVSVSGKNNVDVDFVCCDRCRVWKSNIIK